MNPDEEIMCGQIPTHLAICIRRRGHDGQHHVVMGIPKDGKEIFETVPLDKALTITNHVRKDGMPD